MHPKQIARVCERAGADWAALSWLLHLAELRGDTVFADGYRLALMREEVDVGEDQDDQTGVLD